MFAGPPTIAVFPSLWGLHQCPDREKGPRKAGSRPARPLLRSQSPGASAPPPAAMRGGPKVCRLPAGGNRIRTIGPALVKDLSAVADERCRTDKLDGVIKHRSSRETTMVGRGASLDVRLFLGGTDGSNPVPSSAESASNRSNGVRGQMSANYRLASRPTLTTDLMVENRRKHDQTARICIVIGLSAARAARTARSPASLLRP